MDRHEAYLYMYTFVIAVLAILAGMGIMHTILTGLAWVLPGLFLLVAGVFIMFKFGSFIRIMDENDG